MVATIGVGLGVVYMFGTLGWSFEQTLVERITGRTQADLTITSAYVSGGYQSAPISERVRQAVLAVPGVAAAAGQQRRDIPHEGATLTVDGFDAECFRDPRMCRWVLEGRPARCARDDASGTAFVTGPMRVSWASGPVTRSSCVPSGPQALPGRRDHAIDVAGIVVMSRARLQAGWQDDRISWLFVVVADPTRTAGATRSPASSAVDRLLMPRGPSSSAIWPATPSVQPPHIMEAVVFLLVLIGIGDARDERPRAHARLGMMRAVGLRRADVIRMVVLEAAGICVLGLVLAIGAGGALGVFWVEVQFPLLVGWALDLHLPQAFVAAGAALTLALCLAGALLPSLRAAYVAVPTALRSE
jgi:hypothetical protein